MLIGKQLVYFFNEHKEDCYADIGYNTNYCDARRYEKPWGSLFIIKASESFHYFMHIFCGSFVVFEFLSWLSWHQNRDTFVQENVRSFSMNIVFKVVTNIEYYAPMWKLKKKYIRK